MYETPNRSGTREMGAQIGGKMANMPIWHRLRDQRR
jgi:hypothetical protein